MKLIHTTYDHHDFQLLIRELDQTLEQAIGGVEKHEKFTPFNKASTLDDVVLIYDEEYCAGCGALRTYDAQTAEIKRIFVRPEYRGRRYSELIIRELAKTAGQLNCRRLILETGVFLSASTHMYHSLGFYTIPNYPPYDNISESLCMEHCLKLDNPFAIRYRKNCDITESQLVSLFRSVNWTSANYPARLKQAIDHSRTVSAWDGEQLVGLINAIDDSSLTAYIHYLLVHPDYHKSQIGKTLVDHMKFQYRDYVTLFLTAENKDVIPFYEKQGFTLSDVTPLSISNP